MLKKLTVVAAMLSALAACNTQEPTPVETETFQDESVRPPEVPGAEREK